MGILDGKIAIVTGATRGIGRAIAEEYAKEGAHVAVASRTKSSVEAVAAEIKANGGSAIGVACDIGDASQITAMVQQTVAAFGGVDILVNNAQGFGTRASPTVSNRVTPLEEFTEEEWDWIYDTGVRATLRTMQAAFPHMKARGGGSIINFGSRQGVVGAANSAAYNSCKEAIRGLSRTATNEWGQYNIRVNVINPAIETDAARNHFKLYPGSREHALEIMPLRRWGQPIDCARVAVFLAGPDSSYLSGMTFAVDGGITTLP
jgi:NAD(P)-dependent dehydrogenase (short-subunit alcohol dehydrogenase family)